MVYHGSTLFQISIPDSWNTYMDEEGIVHNFYDSSESADGAMQITAFDSNSKNFNFLEWLEEYQNSTIIEINNIPFVHFEREVDDHKIYNWLTGKDGRMIYLTYSIPRDLDWQETKQIKEIIGSLKIR